MLHFLDLHGPVAAFPRTQQVQDVLDFCPVNTAIHEFIFGSLNILADFFRSLYRCSLDVFFRWLFDKKFLADATMRFE